MTGIEIATAIIEKLQEENRACLDTLHKAQDKIKQQDVMLVKKDQLLKTLEEKLKYDNDGILEMTNRQKAVTIKHLEMQIQKLLKENEDLHANLEHIKSNICVKCESKLLLQEKENKGVSKYYRPPVVATGKVIREKGMPQRACPNRMKSLENIIEHKDKRIAHLSKEVQRLLKTEKELTQKIYRLNKLLPMSHLQSETVTDCLLQEIQLLESQNQRGSLIGNDGLLKSLSDSVKNVSSSQSNFAADKYNKSSVTNIKRSLKNISEESLGGETDAITAENEILQRKLQKICNDVNELKKFFLNETEKLSYGLNCTTHEFNQLKMQLEQIIDNLNEVVHSMLRNKQTFSHNKCTSEESNDKFVISCLQERLKETLGLVSDYEKEIKALNEELNDIKKYKYDKEKFSSKVIDSPKNISETTSMNDVKKLKETIKIRELQLEAAERHISAFERINEELQKTYKHLSFDGVKVKSLLDANVSTIYNADEFKHKEMQNKLEEENNMLKKELNSVKQEFLHNNKKLEADGNIIKSCNDVIEKLQNKIQKVEKEYNRLENELLLLKNQKTDDPQYNVDVFGQVTVLQTKNSELKEKVQALEAKNSELTSQLQGYDDTVALLSAADQKKAMLKNQVNVSEKRISALEENIETLQQKLQDEEIKHLELESQVRQANQEKILSEKYESDVIALKNEIESKEQENSDLKESLHALESKALEINHYRNSLHREIEKLCNLIMEKNDSENESSKRKAIYKAAILHSAQALLKLDENFHLKEEDSTGNSVLEEMKHQIEVYLTEVSRIHELVTIKEHKRDELLREYLDLNDDDLPKGSSVQFQRHPTEANLSSSTLHGIHNLEADAMYQDLGTGKPDDEFHEKTENLPQLRILQEEIASTKSVLTYMVANCTQLETQLREEKAEKAKCAAELESNIEITKDLNSQLNIKNSMIKRLNSLIEMMRSKECNDELTFEHLKSQIKWLIDQNQKIFDKVSVAQTELCHCKEKNSCIQNDLDSLKRQLLNEKYEHSKVLNELRQLRIHLSECPSHLSDT